jgi:hypothetical protein
MRLASTVCTLVLLAVTAGATDHPQEARRLALRSSGVRSTLVWSSKLPAPTLPAESPTVIGAHLRVASGSSEAAWFDLPASGWSAYQAGTRFQYVFQNRRAPLPPSKVKILVLNDQNVMRLSAKSSGITLDEPSQGTMSIQLFVGADVYCSECTTPSQDEPGRYKARTCPAPASCPSQFCGNDVVDQSSEQCDGSDAGICGTTPLPFEIGCQPPTSDHACSCCGVDTCAFSLSFQLRCCGDSQCQDTTGVGTSRLGACIPPTCTQDADCNGYRCVNGTCCGNAGQLCGVVGCCEDSGTQCEFIGFTSLCCRHPGDACSVYSECCSLGCTNGVCD